MKSVILANQKGGVGKSTIASNILVWLSEKQGYKTAGIYTDPQSSLYSFLLGRSELKGYTKNTILFEDSHIPTLKDKLLKYKSKGTDIVVVDTKGHADSSVIKSFGYVDKIIIPMQPSPIDYEATLPLLEILLKEVLLIIKYL